MMIEVLGQKVNRYRSVWLVVVCMVEEDHVLLVTASWQLVEFR
jgi:hypothetical protein